MRCLDKSNSSALRQLNSMVLITILTQIFILLKNALVASHFGVGIELDAYNLSFNITNFVYSFIGAGISTVIIPFLKEKSNKTALNIFITFIYTVSIIIFIFMLLFKNQIIAIAGGSNGIEFINIASNIFVYTLISGILNALIKFANAVLEFKGQFNRQKMIVLFTSIIFVLLLFFFKDISIYDFALILLVTTFISFIAHFYFLKRTNFDFNINFDINNDGFKQMLRLYIPTMMSSGVYQLSLLIDTMISARLDVGSISILNYANSVIGMINMLLLANLTSFMYPRLVKKSNEIDQQKSLIHYILLTNTLMCLIFVLFFIIGREGITILFERGKFYK